MPETQPTLGGTIPRAVFLGCVRWLAEHEPEVSLLTSPHGLCLNSCRGPPHDGLWRARVSHTRPFPRVDFGQGVLSQQLTETTAQTYKKKIGFLKEAEKKAQTSSFLADHEVTVDQSRLRTELPRALAAKAGVSRSKLRAFQRFLVAR